MASAPSYAPVAEPRREQEKEPDDNKVGADDPCTGFGWTVSGFASKAIMSIIFTIAPIMLTAAARGYDTTEVIFHTAEQRENTWLELSGMSRWLNPSARHELSKATWASAGDVDLRGSGLDLSGLSGWLATLVQSPALLKRMQPTSISTGVFAVSLLLQCLGAPLLAATADLHGLHLEMYAGHVLLGVAACFGLAFGQPPLALQAMLVVVLYFAFQICGMFSNAFLPVVASTKNRSTLSLFSSAVSAVGGASFLIVQYLILERAPDDSLSQLQAMQLVCAIAAAMWLCCFLPSFSCLVRLRRPAPTARDGAGGRWKGGVFLRLQNGILRLRQRTHTARFVLAQTFYLAGATSDAAIASIFAQEVVGISLSRITLIAFISALFGAIGALVTLRMAVCVPERPLLMGLMCCPAVMMAYASTLLTTELELWVVSCLRSFVAGGLGFQGLNRGAFAKMIPPGREAEFFGLWMVAISSTSWLGPLVQTVLMQLTQSVQLAAASGLIFYVPALVIMAFTSFELAAQEATAATSLIRDSLIRADDDDHAFDATAADARRGAAAKMPDRAYRSALAGKGNEARVDGAPLGRRISEFFATTFQPPVDVSSPLRQSSTVSEE